MCVYIGVFVVIYIDVCDYIFAITTTTTDDDLFVILSTPQCKNYLEFYFYLGINDFVLEASVHFYCIMYTTTICIFLCIFWVLLEINLFFYLILRWFTFVYDLSLNLYVNVERLYYYQWINCYVAK